MNRPLLSSALFALAAVAPAQHTFQPLYPDFAFLRVSADERYRQVGDENGNGEVYRDGAFAYSNAGYNGGGGGIADSGRQLRGIVAPGYPAALAYVGDERQSDPILLDGFNGLLPYAAFDPVSGRAAVLAYDPARGEITTLVESGSGAPERLVGSAAFGDKAVNVRGITSTGALALTGYGTNYEPQAGVRDKDGDYRLLDFGPGAVAADVRLSADGTDRWLTAIAQDASGYYGTAFRLVGGEYVPTGLRIEGAVGLSSAWGSTAAFNTLDGAYGVDLATGTATEILYANGNRVTGVSNVDVRAGGFYLSTAFGSGFAPVPEPATIATLGLGLAALSRRARKRPAGGPQ